MSKEMSREFFSLNDHLIETADFAVRFNPPPAYSYEVFRVSQQVPLFIEEGQKIKIDTRTYDYVERVKS